MQSGTSAGARTAGAPRRRRVAIAGGRRLTRDGVAALLSADPDLQVVGNVGDLMSTRACVATRDVDVVVAHAWLEDAGGGAQLATVLREEQPTVGVVLLLGDGDAEEINAVLDEGTARRALLLTDHPRCADDLVRAVHEVAEGGSVVHPGVLDLVLRAGSPPPDPFAELTTREREVLSVIATGASNRGIADTLGLSERAVEKHINALFAKLDLPRDPHLHRRVSAVIHYLHACPSPMEATG